MTRRGPTFQLQSNVAIREATSELIEQNNKILLELQQDRGKVTAVTSVAAPPTVEQGDVAVVPVAPALPTLDAQTSNPFGTIATYVEGDRIKTHSVSNVTNMNSGNTTITTMSNSNNNNSYRHYWGEDCLSLSISSTKKRF